MMGKTTESSILGCRPGSTRRKVSAIAGLVVTGGLIAGMALVGQARGHTHQNLVAQSGAAAGGRVKAPQGPPRAPGDQLVDPHMTAHAAPFVFTDEKDGWMVVGDGKIMHSADGGHTWDLQYTSPTPVFSLDFVDAKNGWAVAYDSLLSTQDSGQHWAQAGEPSNLLASVDFIDPAHGWGITKQNGLVLTVDAGRTWSPQANAGHVESACFEDATKGFVGDRSHVITTIDGGVSWQASLSAPADPEAGPVDLRCRGNAATALFPFSVDRGRTDGAVYFSADHGRHWKAALGGRTVTANANVEEEGTPVAITPDGTVVLEQVCTECSSDRIKVGSTKNGGVSFQHKTVSPLDRTDAIPTGTSFIDSNHGWMSAITGNATTPSSYRRVVLETRDAGQTWREIWSGPEG